MRRSPATDADDLHAGAAVLLQSLLRGDTSNPPGGETAAARVLATYLHRHGVECELVARRPDRANLVARIRGAGDGPSLALVGHTDVVPAGDAEACTINLSGEPEGGSLSPLRTPLYDACHDWLSANDPDAELVPTICNGFTNSHYLRSSWGTVAHGFWPIRHTPTKVLHGDVHAVDERVHSAGLGHAARFHVDVCRDFDRRTRRA